uniref:S5 DRBM domain-containing protein n=2 Tax=Chlamydomonas euryale TaxID=1486919 RepID=A0A7R9V1V9_9CHLO
MPKFGASPSMGSFASAALHAVPPAAGGPALPAHGGSSVRCAASSSVADEADEESSTKGGVLSTPRSSSSGVSLEGDEDDEGSAHERRTFRKPRKRSEADGRERAPLTRQQRMTMDAASLDSADPLEFKMLARDSFLDKPEKQIPIPQNIREVLYKFNWDKVLVDVRRTIHIAPRGKQEVYTAMVAVGNLQGLLGLGLADAATAQDAVAKAHMDSYSNLTYVPLYRGHTVFHRVDHSFHRMKMRVMPRHDGWGVRASSLVSELCSLVGIKNVTVQLIGAVRNKFFVAQCFQEALARQNAPHDGIEATGVYLRETLRSSGGGLAVGLQRGVGAP